LPWAGPSCEVLSSPRCPQPAPAPRPNLAARGPSFTLSPSFSVPVPEGTWDFRFSGEPSGSLGSSVPARGDTGGDRVEKNAMKIQLKIKHKLFNFVPFVHGGTGTSCWLWLLIPAYFSFDTSQYKAWMLQNEFTARALWRGWSRLAEREGVADPSFSVCPQMHSAAPGFF